MKELDNLRNKRNADGKICIFILFLEEYELESRKEVENPVNSEIFGRARWKSGCRRNEGLVWRVTILRTYKYRKTRVLRQILIFDPG